MTRAAIYSRYSSDRQSEASCADQIAECRRFAEAKGWTIAEGVVVSEEGISGASRHNRPGLLALVAEAGRAFDVLVVFDVSRLGRNDEDTAGFGIAWTTAARDASKRRAVRASARSPRAFAESWRASSARRSDRTHAAGSGVNSSAATFRARHPSATGSRPTPRRATRCGSACGW